MMRPALALLLLALCVLADPPSAPAQNTLAVELRLSWHAIGAVELDGTQRLKFPDVDAVPGLYRFEMRGQETMVYVGETQNLRRRFGQYRTPGKTQRSNIRICAELRRTLLAGGTVIVSVVTEDAWLCPQSACVRAQLASQNQRRLLEQLAIFSIPPDTHVLNRDKTEGLEAEPRLPEVCS